METEQPRGGRSLGKAIPDIEHLQPPMLSSVTVNWLVLLLHLPLSGNLQGEAHPSIETWASPGIAMGSPEGDGGIFSQRPALRVLGEEEQSRAHPEGRATTQTILGQVSQSPGRKVQ
jgi:hypothetical protein